MDYYPFLVVSTIIDRKTRPAGVRFPWIWEADLFEAVGRRCDEQFQLADALVSLDGPHMDVWTPHGWMDPTWMNTPHG